MLCCRVRGCRVQSDGSEFWGLHGLKDKQHRALLEGIGPSTLNPKPELATATTRRCCPARPLKIVEMAQEAKANEGFLKSGVRLKSVFKSPLIYFSLQLLKSSSWS